MPRVYIPNRSHQDFSKASAYGDLVYLTEGRLNVYKVNTITAQMSHGMRGSAADDLIVVSSLPILMGLACAVFVAKHGCLNVLIFNGSDYEKRNLTFGEFDEAGQAKESPPVR